MRNYLAMAISVIMFFLIFSVQVHAGSNQTITTNPDFETLEGTDQAENWIELLQHAWANFSYDFAGSPEVRRTTAYKIGGAASELTSVEIDKNSDNVRLFAGAHQRRVNFTEDATSRYPVYINFSFYFIGLILPSETTNVVEGSAVVAIDFNTSKHIEYAINLTKNLTGTQPNITNHCFLWVNKTRSKTGVWFSFSRNVTADYAACGFTGAWQVENITLGGAMVTGTISTSEEPGLNMTWDNVYLLSTLPSAPKWSQNATSIASNSQYSPANNYGFSINWTDPDAGMAGTSQGFFLTNLTGSNITYNKSSIPAVTNNTAGIYWINFTNIGVGTYFFQWKANDTENIWNSSDTWIYVIAKNSTNLVRLYLNGTEGNKQITYPQGSNATGNATYQNSGTVNLYRDGVSKTNPDILRLGAGGYTYVANITGNANYSDNTSGVSYALTVDQASTILRLSLNGLESDLTGNYPTQSNATGYYETTLQSLTTNLYRNGSLANTENNTYITLSAKVWNYTYNTSGNTNYSSNSTWRLVTINKGSQNVNLFLNGTMNNNKTYTYPDVINATGNSSTSQLDINVNLYRNNSHLVSGPTQVSDYALLGNSTYEYKVNATSGENYTTNDTGATFYAFVNKGTPSISVTFLPSSTVTYPTTTTTWCNMTTGDPIGNLNLCRNTTSCTSGQGNRSENILLGAAVYNYSCTYIESANYTSISSLNNYLTVNKGAANISLFLDGTESNKSYNQNDVANFTVVTNISGLSVNLTSNYTGFNQQNGTTSIINYTTLSTSGNWWNLTAWTDGNTNYSGSSRTYFFNVTIPCYVVVNETQNCYPSIQAAINAASNYQTVVIFNNLVSEYNESVVVNKTGLTLTSNTSTVPTIFSASSNLSPYNATVNITSSNVIITKVNVKYNGTATYTNAINSKSTSNITIANLTASTQVSAYDYGIYFNGVTNSKIYNVTVRTNGTSSNIGISLVATSSSNNITSNTISTNGLTNNHGVYLSGGMSNNITSNTISTNGTSSDNYGIYLSSSTSNNITYNNISTNGSSSGNRGIYLTGSSSNNITSNNISTSGTIYNYGIYLSSSSNSNKFTSNTISTNGTTNENYGIYLSSSSTNNITYNNISTNGLVKNYGIYLSSSSNSNKFTSNNVITTKTTSYGLYVDNSTNNTFYDSIINATSAYDIYLQNGDSNNATYFINTTFNKSDISSSSSSVAAKLFNQYRLDVQVYNSTNPVESATVIGNDTDSVANLENPTSNFTNTTNSSGYITQQILTEFMANGTYNLGSYLYFNNYTITASKTGYTSNSTTTNLTSSQFLNITLTPVAAAQRVFWNQSSMSMGTIISGQTQSQNTTVNSTGSNTNINVSETSDQCNCFSATPLGPYSLGNGGSQQTQFSAAPQSGLTNGTTYSGTYIVNSTENGTIDQITISFVYRAENYWNQSSLSIGNVGNESAVSKNVTVNATGDTSDVEIYDVSGNGTFITADPYIIGNLNNGATHQVQFTCAPNTPTLGYYERIFSVNSTEMTSGRNITVSCNVFVTDNPPRWRYQSENATDIAVGEVVLLSAQGYDALGLWQAILSTNESGNWQNFTDNLYGSPINLNNQTGYSWSNFTWQNSSIINKTVSWKIYYKDNASQYNVTNTLDFWSGGALRGELSGPCTTNKNNPRDKCHSNIGENATFSLTFRYTDSPSYNSSYNGTIHLRYGISTNPRTDDASISIPQTTDCTGNTFIVKSTTINTCNGFINCGVAGNGDTNFYNTSQGINHELNVTFTVQSCANTSGKTYDIDANLVGTTTGRIISDSYLILHIIPKPFWNKTTSGELWSSPAVANLNGDSTIDIVIGDVDGTIHAYDGNNSTEVWNTSTGAEIWSSPTVADVWNNGTAYVAIGDGNNVSLIHGKTGKMVWNKTTGDLVASTPAFYDINGDGILDVIVGSSDNSVYALYGNNGSQIWSYPTEAMIWTSSPVIANVVGSLAPEVIIGSNDANMYALNITNGNKLWNTSVYDANVYLNGGTDGSATVADINSDGVQEVVFGSYNGNIYALRGDNGNQVWSFPTGSWIMSSPIAVHLFNDDTWQIVFGSHSPDGRVYALNGENGTQIWNQSVRGHADSPPTILDVDGDGYKDVVTGSSNWSVYAFNGIDGNIMWLYNVNNYVMGSPAVSDLNADGHPEIVALTTEGKSIVTIDPPGESDSFRGGEFRTGTYDNNPPQYSKSGYNPTSSGLFLYSFWKDSLSNLVKAEIRENSTGQWTATSIDLKGVSAWINYTISKLEKDKTLSFSITVFDDYGNKNTYAGSYSSAVSVSGPSASQPVCGNSICESGETTQSCPQDCPTGAAPTPIQLPSSPIFDFLPLIIGVVLVVFIVLAFVVL